MLDKIICSSSLVLTVSTLALPASAKPLIGVYWPYASDISLEIENNRFREGVGVVRSSPVSKTA
jgi:hypothetical protein